MDHFYTQQKRQTPISYQRPKKKKTQLKLAWKKKPKDRWKENAKKKEFNFRPEKYCILLTQHKSTHETNEFCRQDRSSCQRSFRMANNIACCCASMGTRILLTSLVDLVTGCVRTKWLTRNHCEAKKKKEKKEKKGTDLCQILWTDLFFFPFSFQRRRPNKQGV